MFGRACTSGPMVFLHEPITKSNDNAVKINHRFKFLKRGGGKNFLHCLDSFCFNNDTKKCWIAQIFIIKTIIILCVASRW